MTRDREVRCLEYIINAYCDANNGILVFDNVNKHDLLIKYLKVVSPNPQTTKFPDFISKDVIVEHFSITSSIENKKGSSFMIEKNYKDKEVKEKIDEWQKSCSNTVYESSNVIENVYDNFTYNNFLISLNKNLTYHIDSLNKYDAKGKRIIFLIELQTATMCIYNNNVFCGFYELNKDKNALDIIKPFANLIDIIIFRANERIEIIDINKFGELYAKANCEKDIRGGRLREVFLNVKLDLMV